MLNYQKNKVSSKKTYDAHSHIYSKEAKSKRTTLSIDASPFIRLLFLILSIISSLQSNHTFQANELNKVLDTSLEVSCLKSSVPDILYIDQKSIYFCCVSAGKQNIYMGAEVDFVVPSHIVAISDVRLVEECRVFPSLENAASHKMRQIGFALHAVREQHPYPIASERLHLGGD